MSTDEVRLFFKLCFGNGGQWMARELSCGGMESSWSTRVQNWLIITLQVTADVNQRTADNYIDNPADQQATHKTEFKPCLHIRTRPDRLHQLSDAEVRLNNISENSPYLKENPVLHHYAQWLTVKSVLMSYTHSISASCRL